MKAARTLSLFVVLQCAYFVLLAAEGPAARAGYATGGMLGSALGIWLTRVWG